MDAQLRLLTPQPHRAPRSGRPSRRPTRDPLDDLVEAPTTWRLDESTKAVGRSGLAQARDALRRAQRPLPHPTADTDDTAHHPLAAPTAA